MKKSIVDIICYRFHTPNTKEVWNYCNTYFDTTLNSSSSRQVGSYISVAAEELFKTTQNWETFIPTDKFKELIGMTNTKKEFTKSDLKDGMVVEYVRGGLRMLVGDSLLGIDSYHNFGGYSEDLRVGDGLDIVKVYKIDKMRPLNELLTQSAYLELIWERNTKSPQQLEKEAIEQEMLALKERLSKLEV